MRIALPADAAEPMAESADGYRTLDGWLAQLSLAARVDRRGVVDADLVAPILEGDPTDLGPTLDAIARAVALAFGLRLRDLKSGTRRAVVAEGRDPATVRHACKAAEARLAADPGLAAACSALARGWGGERSGRE